MNNNKDACQRYICFFKKWLDVMCHFTGQQIAQAWGKTWEIIITNWNGIFYIAPKTLILIISGSSWRFRTKKKTGLMFASSFLLAWLFLCCICFVCFICWLWTKLETDVCLYRKFVWTSEPRRFFHVFIFPSDMSWVPSLC